MERTYNVLDVNGSSIGNITSSENNEIVCLIENNFITPEDIAFLNTIRRKDGTMLVVNDDKPVFTLV